MNSLWIPVTTQVPGCRQLTNQSKEKMVATAEERASLSSSFFFFFNEQGGQGHDPVNY